MERKNSLLSSIINDFPQFNFAPSDSYRWSPSSNTVFYADDNFSAAQMLHELSHALLGHTRYLLDIELIRIESDAWNYARETLSKRYKITIEQGEIDESMDSYREWLHVRSICVECRESGLQTTNGTYQCLNCGCQWRANEARICQIRRYRVN